LVFRPAKIFSILNVNRVFYGRTGSDIMQAGERAQVCEKLERGDEATAEFSAFAESSALQRSDAGWFAR